MNSSEVSDVFRDELGDTKERVSRQLGAQPRKLTAECSLDLVCRNKPGIKRRRSFHMLVERLYVGR